VLKLFVSGTTAYSQRVQQTVRSVCDEELSDRYELSVIDVVAEPHRAEHDRVIATPTLIKSFPLPARRVVGDFSNRDELLSALDLAPSAQDGSEGSIR